MTFRIPGHADLRRIVPIAVIVVLLFAAEAWLPSASGRAELSPLLTSAAMVVLPLPRRSRMTATVVVVTNPFDRVNGRSIHAVAAGQTVGDLLTEAGIAPARGADGPEVLVCGIALSAEVFAVRVICPGEVVSVIRWPQGGGGGGGGKSPLRTILTIAVMVAGAAFGGAVAGMVGLEGSATIFGSFTVANAVGGVLAMAGAALINTVIPAPSPAVPSESWGGSAPAPSPTYSLQSQGNQGRLEQPIPVGPSLCSTPAWSPPPRSPARS